MTRGTTFWPIMLVVSMIVLALVFGKDLNAFLTCHPVVFGQTRMDDIEWECVALPPEGTKFRDDMRAGAVHKDRKKAEELAVWFCNKLFKTDKCKIEYCEQVRKRK